jgi:hypothetical protein
VRASQWRKAGLLLCLSSCLASASLPVYIEDSHAGSFYWLAQNLNLTSDYDLILVDAHSDSTEIADSDVIRRKLLESAGANQLASLLRDWRTRGTIQCFNWLEPLIPRPISKVWFIPAKSLTTSEIAARRLEIRRQINAHEMTRPRSEGDLSGRFAILDWDHFAPARFNRPVVASIDLDYFASDSNVAEVFDKLLKLPRLDAITIAISRPYLGSDQQAHLLVGEVIRYLSRVINSEIHFEPYARTGEDWSQRAKQFYSRGLAVPHYEVAKAPPFLRGLMLQNANRIHVSQQSAQWSELLDNWRCDDHLPVIRVSAQEVRLGLPLRVTFDDLPDLPGRHIRWKALLPTNTTYNLTGESQGFANGAPKYLTYRETTILRTDDLLELTETDLIPYLDSKTGLGTLRVYCELTDGRNTYLSNIVRFSRTYGRGYPGRLSEIFNLPYVYGSALIDPDSRYGADCSNFIIYGRRREGGNIPYVNPQGLLPYLETLDEFRGFQSGVAQGLRGPIVITEPVLRRGLLLHLGKHVAAISDGVGPLTGTTPVVHQLEGYPEITTFLAMARKYPRIRIMTFK